MPWKCCLVTPSGTSQGVTVEMCQPLSPLSHARGSSVCTGSPAVMTTVVQSSSGTIQGIRVPVPSKASESRYHPRHQSQTYSVHIVTQACDPCTREAEAGESRVGGQIGSHSETLSFLITLFCSKAQGAMFVISLISQRGPQIGYV